MKFVHQITLHRLNCGHSFKIIYDSVFSLQTPLVLPAVHTAGGEVSRYSVYNSQSSLIHSVQPSDCSSTGYALGGVTMKMMDEVAGIVAFRHCKSNVVTASIGKVVTCDL